MPLPANKFERRELTALRSSSHIDTAFEREYLFLFTNQSTASEADSRMSLISAARKIINTHEAVLVRPEKVAPVLHLKPTFSLYLRHKVFGFFVVLRAFLLLFLLFHSSAAVEQQRKRNASLKWELCLHCGEDGVVWLCKLLTTCYFLRG